MPRTSFRIVKSKWASTAFDGEGARRHGGRWNSVGTRMIYTSESRSLAALEILVHLQGPAIGFSLISCDIPDGTPFQEISEANLPDDWRAQPASPELARLGDEWIVQAHSVALRVPSAVVDGEYNILLNRAHPDFKMLRIHAAVPFPYDPRLVELTGNR